MKSKIIIFLAFALLFWDCEDDGSTDDDITYPPK